MSTASLDQLSDALVDALAQDHGSGADAGLDLSGAGKVLRGSYPRPPRLPFASVSGVQIVGSRNTGANLRGWGYDLTWVLRAWIPATSADLSSRVIRAETVLQALVGAVATAGSTPGNPLYAVADLTWTTLALDAELDGGPEACQVAMVVSGRTTRVGAP